MVSAGASIDNLRRTLRQPPLRFGPRALVEDNSVQSGKTTGPREPAGPDFQLTPRGTSDQNGPHFFNLFDAEVSDIDYSVTSRLPGEPLVQAWMTFTSSRQCADAPRQHGLRFLESAG